MITFISDKSVMVIIVIVTTTTTTTTTTTGRRAGRQTDRNVIKKEDSKI
jgi:hypothetical protein